MPASGLLRVILAKSRYFLEGGINMETIFRHNYEGKYFISTERFSHKSLTLHLI
jgi:hypothetical protein